MKNAVGTVTAPGGTSIDAPESGPAPPTPSQPPPGPIVPMTRIVAEDGAVAARRSSVVFGAFACFTLTVTVTAPPGAPAVTNISASPVDVAVATSRVPSSGADAASANVAWSSAGAAAE